MNTYADFQNQASSEKITLAILSASKRLMGWELHSGSVYKLTNFNFAIIASIEDLGASYTEVLSIGSVAPATYYLDRTAKILYLKTAGSDNPNSRFLVGIVKLYYSNIPVTLPHDLDGGFEVYWEPLINSTSQFGVEIDIIEQTSEAIEGSGSLTLFNDFDFWPKNYDKLSFENQQYQLYSYNRELNASDAKLIFKGRVETQKYNKNTIVFNLKDQFAELRAPIEMATIGSLGLRTGNDLDQAKQRHIYGRVFGIVPTNIDQVLDGYPITGTISISYGDIAVTGYGTLFLKELSPSDKLILNGKEYSIATVSTNTSLTLTEIYIGNVNLVTAHVNVSPDKPKRYVNRKFLVAGHPTREPSTVIEAGSDIDTLLVTDTSDIYSGDTLYIGSLGSGNVVTVASVSGQHVINLSTSLAETPLIGTSVLKPGVQNVRIDDIPLEYYRDYTYNSTSAILTLRESAETNAGSINQSVQNATFTIGSAIVTGTGFDKLIEPGNVVSAVGMTDYYEVLSVDSNTQLTLRVNALQNNSPPSPLKFKTLVYTPDKNVLTLDCMGRTDDGTPSGSLLNTAPEINEVLLIDAGLSNDINTASFTLAKELVYQDIGIIIPENYSDTSTPTYRDILNKVNKSVFGSLVQDQDFNFSYIVLQPNKNPNARRFAEHDVLSFTLDATAEQVVKTVIIQYKRKEYDYLTKSESTQTKQVTSDHSTFVTKTDRQRIIETYLVNDIDAAISSARWSFLLQHSSSRLTLSTKLQKTDLNIGDIIEIEHRKFFDRYGSSITGYQKLFLVESVKRSGLDTNIVATDLSNLFNRVAAINTLPTNWDTATDSDRLYGGYYTDTYGLINNDPNSFEVNLIW